MANVSNYLKQIMSARYGKDVRQALYDSIKESYEMAEKSKNEVHNVQQQPAELIKQQTIANLSNSSLTALEKNLAAEYNSMKNGKVFARKIYHYDTNTTSACEAMKDTVGLTATPSTDTVEGVDDFLGASIIFTYQHCNYVPDADGTKRVKVLEGTNGYATEGAVDVGTLAPTFYWKMEDMGTYDVLYMSDTPHPELGLVPWVDAVKADGTVLPYYIISTYASVNASDGYLRSQPNKAPAYNQSYVNTNQNYPKKGTGYFGSGLSRELHGFLFYIMKYGYKNSQKVFAGCSNFNIQPKIALAESDTYRVLVASTNTRFNAGDCVSVGTATDRGISACHSIVNRALVKKKEVVTIDDTSYIALTLDISEKITTTTDYYVTSMPCFSGQTDEVVGMHDGSLVSNTDGCHTFRLHGVEYMNGQYIVASDTMVEMHDGYWEVYVAQKGTKRSTSNHDGYLLAGKIPYANGSHWVGDFGVNEQVGAYYPTAKGGGDSVGVGDYIYENTNEKDGALREYLVLGSLRAGSSAGFGLVYVWFALSDVSWYIGSCD